MEIQQIQIVRKYVDIVVRRKALIGCFILLGLAVGLAYYLQQPKLYKASTLLSYQQQKISPARMSPDAQTRIRDIVSTLTQIITSRSSLEKIIEDLGLYQNARQNLPMEDVIENMRKKIDIQPSRRGDTFVIAFTGKEPQKITRVANTLASKFIEENLKYREERASETFSYTQNELQMAKETLDRKDEVMRDYKLKYYNEMPEQRANNMSRLNSLQEQYQNRQESIQDLEKTSILIQDQIAARKKTLAENRALANALIQEDFEIQSDPGVSAPQLAELKDRLALMLERYTEKHPAVRRLKGRIAHLEKTLDLQPQQSGSDDAAGKGNNEPFDMMLSELEKTVDLQPQQGGSDDAAGKENNEPFDMVLSQLQRQLKDIRLNIERLNEEKEKLKASIDKYEKWIEAAPVRGAEWSAITREYAELKRHYDNLVAQNLQARSALNLERKQKGSQFTIEDPARRPHEPIKPDFMVIMAMALVAGGGLGGALALGRDLLDSSFKDPAELEEYLNVDLLCTVPYVTLKKERTRKLIVNSIGAIVFVMSSAALLAAFLYFYKAGRIVL